MKLQVAIDTDLKKGMKVLEKVSKEVDIIEIGTPLMKEEGLGVVKKLKKFRKKIFLDMKTMDTGFYEAMLGFNAGADMVSVCAAASDETIKGAIKAGRKYKKDVLVDLIGIPDSKLVKRAKEISKMKPTYICVHTGIDCQMNGKSPFDNLRKISRAVGRTKIAVAGGIKEETLGRVLKESPEIVIVGGAITKAKNPERVSKILGDAVHEA